jgi:hypothetical protein
MLRGSCRGWGVRERDGRDGKGVTTEGTGSMAEE